MISISVPERKIVGLVVAGIRFLAAVQSITERFYLRGFDNLQQGSALEFCETDVQQMLTIGRKHFISHGEGQGKEHEFVRPQGDQRTGNREAAGHVCRRFGPALAVLLSLATFPSLAERGYDRWVRLQGAVNFRDMGAYDVGTTQAVAKGLVFRSASLAGITASDAAIVRSLGILRIIDLRTTAEIVASADSPLLNAFATHLYIPVGFSGATSIEVYQNLIRNSGNEWRQVFQALADPRSLPLNYHCQAGKDRAGVLTALILTFLGVKRETVIQDYLLSNEAYYPVYQSWIEAALDTVETSGGIELYLGKIGTTASVRRAVRTNLLVPRPTRARPSWSLYP
jgi:protein tyrosine/serine phosphatase